MAALAGIGNAPRNPGANQARPRGDGETTNPPELDIEIDASSATVSGSRP